MTEDKSGTLHQRILDDIERRILSGEWPPGHHLPFEVDLAARYGCSRMTMNKVMTQLAKSGLVERRRKSGTFVAHPRSQSAVLEIRDIRAEVESLKLSYGYRLISRDHRKARGEELQRFGLDRPTEVLELWCLHFANDRPFCLERRVINLSVVPAAIGFDFELTSPGPLLMVQIPWTRADHIIGAVGAGIEESRYLEVSAGHACLVIERRTWSSWGPVTHVSLTYRGEDHRLYAQFGPSMG